MGFPSEMPWALVGVSGSSSVGWDNKYDYLPRLVESRKLAIVNGENSCRPLLRAMLRLQALR